MIGRPGTTGQQQGKEGFLVAVYTSSCVYCYIYMLGDLTELRFTN